MGDEGTAAPIGIPVPAIGVPGSLPSGEVALIGGVVAPMPSWADTGLQQYEAQTTAIINNGLMRGPQIKLVKRRERQVIKANYCFDSRARSYAGLRPRQSRGSSYKNCW
jgi:hypothetical protein